MPGADQRRTLSWESALTRVAFAGAADGGIHRISRDGRDMSMVATTAKHTAGHRRDPDCSTHHLETSRVLDRAPVGWRSGSSLRSRMAATCAGFSTFM